MSHVRRLVFVTFAVGQIAGLVVILNTAGAEAFDIAYSLSFVQQTWVKGALDEIRFVGYTLIVPILLVDVLVYLAIGAAQDERRRNEQVTRRRL